MTSVARQSFKLFVGNLPWTVSNNELLKYFSKYGPVTSASVVFDHEAGFSKGYGFVIFNSADAYNKAFDEKIHLLEARVLNVQQSKA